MAKKRRIDGKTILYLSEKVRLVGKGTKKDVAARVDTGATNSALDVKLAAELNLGPIIKTKFIKSTHGNGLRPVVEAEILLAGKRIKSEFTLADRSHMKYKVLVGQNILSHNGYLIDPQK